MRTRRFQVMDLEVTVSSGDEALLRALELLAQDAAQQPAPTRSVAYTVVRDGDRYAIAQDGVPCGSEFHAGGVVSVLSALIYERAFAALKRGVLVRALTGGAGERRFLVLGEQGCGLSSLAVRLLHEGIAVQGDWLALIVDGWARAVPRPFYLYDDACSLLPALSEVWERLPCHEGQAGMSLFAYHPDRAGCPWRIAAGEVDVLIELHGDHGFSTRLSAVPHYQMAKVLTAASLQAPWQPVSQSVAELARLAGRAGCHRLRLGSLDDALSALRPALGTAGTAVGPAHRFDDGRRAV